MLGEEQEQVFSVVSRKASTTKHESRAGAIKYFFTDYLSNNTILFSCH